MAPEPQEPEVCTDEDPDKFCPTWPDCPHWEQRKWEFYIDEFSDG